MAQPITWSYSSLQKFIECPKRYFEEKVAKRVKQRPTEASTWGERVHKGMENALHQPDPGGAMDGDLATLAPVAQRFSHVKGDLATEQQLAITYTFRPTEWFAADVWCRGILDAVWIDGDVAKIVDWKTGKRKRDSGQLKLFALLLFAHRPEVERVNTSFVWLTNGKMDVEKYHRKDVPILWQDILPDVRRLEYAHKTQTWIPKPSALCGWCPVQSCSFWKGFNGERR